MDLGPSAQAEHDSLEGVPSPAATLEVAGHDAAMRAIVDAHAVGRLHHAWLLQGPRGIGKATFAFAFARRLLGEDDSEDTARQIAGGAHPNLVHITRPAADRGDGFRTQITVDEVRKLNRFFQTTSGNARWRVAIIDPVDDMNRNAANALLKILEEPPARSLFLIVNHLGGRLLPTIRSRCRVLRLDPLPKETLVDVLTGLEVPASGREREAAATRAEGSVRNAVVLLTNGGLEIEDRLDAILAAKEPEWHGIQALADELSQRGQETAFELAAASLFARLATESEAASKAGRPVLAGDYARLWANESARIREGLAFNLDRKQMLMTHFRYRFAIRGRASAD